MRKTFGLLRLSVQSYVWIQCSHAIKELSGMPPGRRFIVSICADGGEGSVALLQT